jgi:predicted nucleic acid-binding protein
VAFVVVYDANVLFPNTLRDLLIRVAQSGLVQAKWTNAILDETFRNVIAHRPDIDVERLNRTRQLMNRAVRDCLVFNYEPLIEILDLPDPDDRHVLAAAIKARAQLIVTMNLKDFPSEVLRPWHVEAKHPDQFLLDQLDLDRDAIEHAVELIAKSRQCPPETAADVLAQLENSGIAATVHELRCRRT